MEIPLQTFVYKGISIFLCGQPCGKCGELPRVQVDIFYYFKNYVNTNSVELLYLFCNYFEENESPGRASAGVA